MAYEESLKSATRNFKPPGVQEKTTVRLDAGTGGPRGRSHDGVRTTLILSRSDIDGLVSMTDVIASLETAYGDVARGTASQPSPTAMSLGSSAAKFLAMPSLADRQGLASVKLLADIPDNRGRELPVQRSVVVLVSQATGACVAILHGQIPTRIRTAAASAVATRHLARTDARVLGMIGAGDLAVEHVNALMQVRQIKRVMVWSRNPSTVIRFAARVKLNFPDLDVESASSPCAVVEGSDIVCTLTPSREPIVEGAWFKPGQHINAVGAPPRADHREIDSVGVARARVFLDSWGTAMHESGDVLLALADGAIAQDHVATELGHVIIGAAPGRIARDDITLYNSVGIGIQDLAMGSLLLERARQKGVGLEIDLGA